MMRLLLISLLLLLAASCSVDPGLERQMLSQGRVATYESVLAEAHGDTALAAQMAVPLPVNSSYLTLPRRRAEHAWNLLHLRFWPLGATIAALALSLFAGRRTRRVAYIILALLQAADFALRWELADAIPLTTGGDTLAAIALAASVILCFTASRRYAVGLLVAIAALLVGALAMNGHPALRPVNPSLVSAWLPVHVGLMMCAYSCFLAATVVAIIGEPGRKTLKAIVLGEDALIAGIVVGALWAAEAWGRYWGWDPKETWALVTSLVYLALIAVWPATARRPRLRRLLTIAAFIAVAFTWWGVNRLGGLHAY